MSYVSTVVDMEFEVLTSSMKVEDI